MQAGCGGIILGVMIAIAACVLGCASTGSSVRGEDRTDGVRLTLQVERGVNSIVRYRVARDGTIAYAGGAVARRDDWGWTGMMSDDEIRGLRDLLDQYGWERGGLDRPGDRDGDVVVYRVDLWTPQIRERFLHVGESDRIAPVHAYLEDVCGRRHQEFMSTLPKPNLEERDEEAAAKEAVNDG